MRLVFSVATIACSAVIAAGCSGAAGPVGESRPTTAFDIKTAPLTLPGVGFVCYDFRVRNGQGETVVERGVPGVPFYSPTAVSTDPAAVCSSQFGNSTGGDISYVAPCDASLVPVGNEIHTVTIWVDGLYSGTQATPTGALAYLDPCPNGCSLPARCAENADTPVTFNLTIMRPANQGFFDIAVTFDDIFCSAKLDCTYEGESSPITLLHNPDKPDQPRDTTFVVGLACTGGENSDTHLYMNPGELVCYAASVMQGVRVNFQTTGLEEGNMRDAGDSFNITTHAIVASGTGLAWGPPNGTTAGNPFVFQHAYYRGIEALGNYNKVYSNAAYGIDYALLHAHFATFGSYTNDARCVYSNHATASDGPMSDDLNVFYPQVQFCAEVYGANSVCAQNPLNDPDAPPIADFNDLSGTMQGGVYTTYSMPSGPDDVSTCAPDVNPPYELCIHPVSGELVACDPIEGTPAFEVTRVPRPDVAHGATNCDGTPLSVSFTLQEGWAYCRVGHIDTIEDAAYELCGYPDVGETTWNFWEAEGPPSETYGTQKLEILVSDGTSASIVYENTWYVHESLAGCCYCDEIDNDGQTVAWPSDEAFFAAALEPITREEYRWIVASRSLPGELFPSHTWELPEGGVLDTSDAFGPDTTLLPPVQMISVSDVSIVGLPEGFAMVEPASSGGQVSANPGYSRNFSWGTCSIKGGACTHDLTCKTFEDTVENVCEGTKDAPFFGEPLYHKVDVQSNRAFEAFQPPDPLAQFRFDDLDPDDASWTQGGFRQIPGAYDFGNIVESAYAGTPRFKSDSRGERNVPTTTFDLEIMSLRKRFSKSVDDRLILISRSVGSRNTFWETGERDCRMTLTYGFYADKLRRSVDGGSETYPEGMRRQEITVDAIVINARGQGFGLRVNPATGRPEKVVFSDRMIAKFFRGSVAGRNQNGVANREVMSPKVYDPDRVYSPAWQVTWGGVDVSNLGPDGTATGAGTGGSSGTPLPVLSIWK